MPTIRTRLERANSPGEHLQGEMMKGRIQARGASVVGPSPFDRSSPADDGQRTSARSPAAERRGPARGGRRRRGASAWILARPVVVSWEGAAGRHWYTEAKQAPRRPSARSRIEDVEGALTPVLKIRDRGHERRGQGETPTEGGSKERARQGGLEG